MNQIIISILIILFFNFNFGNCNPILKIVNNNIQTNENSLEFNITLSDNEMIKVNLTFEFMRDQRKPDVQKTSTISSISTTKGKTTNDGAFNDDDDDDEFDGFTAEDAIELFQSNLIEKERNIGGILNASEPFYRYFNLKYKSTALSIRCIYKSNYERKTLNIKCTQYYETTVIERILANGEIEKTVVNKDPNDLPQIILNEDINSYTQTYEMIIS